MKPGQIHEPLKARAYYDERIRVIFPHITDSSLALLRTLIYDAQHHCNSCGEARSGDCPTCERMWRS